MRIFFSPLHASQKILKNSRTYIIPNRNPFEFQELQLQFQNGWNCSLVLLKNI